MSEKRSTLESIRNKIPKYIHSGTKLVEYEREHINDKPSDWNMLVIASWDLGRLLLAKNEIKEARKYFAEGTTLILDGDRMREDILPMTAASYETPLKAYLGDLSIGKLLSRTPTIKLEELNDPIRIYMSWHYGLYGLIKGNDDYVRHICDFIVEKTKDFKLGPDGMPPSITHKRLSLSYAIYSMRMLNAVIDNDSEEFSKNMNFRSRLKMRVLSRADNPMALVDLGFVVLYDVALGRGLKPKVETPFIPETILENGYWFRPKSKES